MKPSYDDLRQKVAKLESRIKELETAMKQADRAVVGYPVERWVSLPLPDKQLKAIKDVIADQVSNQYANGKLLRRDNGVELWEDIFHADDFRDGRPLAEWPAYLVRLHTHLQQVDGSCAYGHYFEKDFTKAYADWMERCRQQHEHYEGGKGRPEEFYLISRGES